VSGEGLPAAGRSLAAKIEWLIGHMWPADAPPPKTNADVSAAISAATGEEMSSTSIWKLRTGRGDNPTFKTLTALATFFGVPFGYFGEGQEAQDIADQAALVSLLRREGVTSSALLSLAGLSPGNLRLVMDMIASAARIEEDKA
jgi:hypothetical protein